MTSTTTQASVPSARKAVISLRGVSIGYDRPIIEALDLDILAGEILFIGGGSGCGKTTLLSCLTTLRKPLSGSIAIDGTDIVRAAPDTLREVRRRPLRVALQVDGHPRQLAKTIVHAAVDAD